MKELLQTIFSVRNSQDKTHKIITLLGIKLKFNKKYIKHYMQNYYIMLNPKDKHEYKYLKDTKDLDYYIINTLIKQNDNVVDVGANIGYQTIRYLNKGANMVYAFEPISKLYSRCKNIARQTKKLKLYHCALGSQNAYANINVSTSHNQGATLNPAFLIEFKNVYTKQKLEKVKIKKIDDIKFEEKIDFIKIDCEGSEKDIFIGGEKFFKEHNPIVQIEIYDFLFEVTCKEIKKYYQYIKRAVVKNNKLILLDIGEKLSTDEYQFIGSATYVLYNENHKKRVEKNFNGSEALYKMIKDYSFHTVLDIGCGEGIQSNIFIANNKKVTAIDYGKSHYLMNNTQKHNIIIGDFSEYDFGDTKFDAVWCSHVLEHVKNPNLFLTKIHSVLKEGGVLAITVPPLKNQIVGGHLSLWNIGLLLYHLIIAGFDCRHIIAKKYGYNISVILTKKTINITDQLVYDSGDITKIKVYLPDNINYSIGSKDISFDGNIENINWEC